MFSGFHKTVITLVVIVIFYTTDFLLLSRYDRERRAEGSGRSWDFTVMVVIVAAFLVVQPALLPWMGLHTDAWWGELLQVVGIFLLLGAFGLHWWARVHLRQFYAERVEIQPEHRLVTSGPYAYMRHPTFTSFFTLAIGLILVNPSLPTLMAAIYTFWDFSRAARQEEELLAENLPGYADYIARTPRFLPRPRKCPRDN
jgi:protein-S-isoprenylcysteine O-methyltransferase